MGSSEKNPKSYLNELVQRNPGSVLKAEDKQIKGEGGTQLFEVTCTLNHIGRVFKGVGRHISKKTAETEGWKQIADKIQLEERKSLQNAPGPSKAQPIPTKAKTSVDNNKPNSLTNSTTTPSISTKSPAHNAAKTELNIGIVLDDEKTIEEATQGNSIGLLKELCDQNPKKFDTPIYKYEQFGEGNNSVHQAICKVGKHEFNGTAKIKKTAQKIAAFKTLQIVRKELHVVENVQTPQPTSTIPVLNNQNLGHTSDHVGPMKRVKEKIFYNEKANISTGGNAAVFKGYFEVPSKKAAVKKLFSFSTADENQIKNEITLLREVEDKYLVRYFATETDPLGVTFIAMQYANQGTLDKIACDKKVPVQDVHELLKHATKGLIALHDKDIIHRDIKPSNILVFDNNGKLLAKLADFGISRKLKSFDDGTFTDANKGTTHWMPPEALEAINKKFRILPSFDIFSLGATIAYSMLRGKHPFGEGVYIAPKIIQSDSEWENNFKSDDFKIKNLLRAMFRKDSVKRPSASILLEHPFFWKSHKTLDFVTAVSNDMANQEEVSKFKQEMNQVYQEYCKKIGIMSDWRERLCPAVKNFMRTREHPKKYGPVIMKLVEFIRDHDQHYQEILNHPDLAKDDVFGTDSKNYPNYFNERFPELITFLYTYFQDRLKQGVKVNEFYKLNNKISYDVLALGN